MEKDLEKNVNSFDEEEFMLNKLPDEAKKEIKPEIEIEILDDTEILSEDIIEKIVENNAVQEKKSETIVEIKEDDFKNIVEETEKSNEEKIEVKEEKKHKIKKEKKQKEKKKSFAFPNDKKGRIIYIIEAIFCILSISFVIGCCVHYGSRLVKYYRIYNPKTENGETIELIASTLLTKAEYATGGDGLYRIGGASIFKGKEVNNYFYFSNQMWRIISVNPDGSIELVSDNYINALSLDSKISSFNNSNLSKYLNDVYLNTLKKEYLSKTSYCADQIEDVTKITCNENITEQYVRLLGISEFLNSKVDNSTYLNLNNDSFWLYNSNSKGGWIVNGINLTSVDATSGYLVKPVVRIKNSVQLLGGTGTLEDPYYIEEEKNELNVGKYVKLGEDIWVIYEEKENTINLALENNLSKMYRFSLKNNSYDILSNSSLAMYLNNDYLLSLSYQNIINENDWYVGSYDGDYENILKKTVKAKVGLYNIYDLKFSNALETYYMLTPAEDNYVYLYNNGLTKSKVTLARNIKPTININKYNISSGKGTLVDPYMLEV